MVLTILMFYIASTTSVILESNESIDDKYYEQYLKALNTTKIPITSRIDKSLTPLLSSTPGLVFDSENFILLSSSCTMDEFPHENGDSFQLSEDTWFTAYPFLQQTCQGFDKDSLYIRVKQLLGLPPNSLVTGVVELYVSLNDIFRPCPDPEIFDQECIVYEPVANNNSIYPEVPWYCPGSGEIIKQIGGKYSTVSKEHFEWMCNWWKASYENLDIYHNYPWTAL